MGLFEDRLALPTHQSGLHRASRGSDLRRRRLRRRFAQHAFKPSYDRLPFRQFMYRIDVVAMTFVTLKLMQNIMCTYTDPDISRFWKRSDPYCALIQCISFFVEIR
jgi:hypothetical protein